MTSRFEVIFPAYNEEKRLLGHRTLEAFYSHLTRLYGLEFSMTVVLNGCTDKSFEIVERLANKHQRLKVLVISEKGKGAAFIHGLRQVTAPLFAFIDIDGAIAPEQLDRLLPYTRSADIVFGSRKLPSSFIRKQPPLIRRLNSSLAGFCVRSILATRVRDPFCGIKIFKTASAKNILPSLKCKSSMIDSNILYAARQAGLKVVEAPVEWGYVEGSKVKLRSDLNCLIELFKIKHQYCGNTLGFSREQCT
ncbi:MAG: glycosyltransferase [Candidatus Margulisbacteria bacterium]|nr:glycosyltransferase [Candidatus Margulisiibacteriota bacterium]MBU1617579.1 glycosyltransferase [Candidatus Margulisiibacteriota bacterium]MBU1866917.1 glycosyltransferase [Candidatus Margulisiibacteriota bacterium]